MLVEAVESLMLPCEKSLLIAATETPLPICKAAFAPLTPSVFKITSAKVIDWALKAVVLALAMLLPVTPSASELPRRPERAVENKNDIETLL